jgi:hypothetical protein
MDEGDATMDAKSRSTRMHQVPSILADPIELAMYPSLTPLAAHELRYGHRAAATYFITSVWVHPEELPGRSMLTSERLP